MSIESQPILGHVLVVGPTCCEPAAVPLLRTRGWTWEAVTPAQALRRLRTPAGVDLVLIEPPAGADTTRYLEFCRTIKFDSRTSFVPAVWLVPANTPGLSGPAFEAGADDVIAFPATEHEVAIRLTKAVRYKRATDSLDDATTVITALANAVEGKDAYTCGHVERVGVYSVQIGRRVGVDADGLEALRVGGVVHDIGKVGIPDHVLNKPGKLTDDEMAVMRRHPVIGYDILKPLRTFHNVLPIVRWHHEKPNGRGYPDGLAGDQLPLLPRITAVADVFDALITDRPYRPAFPLATCRDMLRDSGERGDLDPTLVAALCDILDEGTLTALPAAAAKAA